MFNALPTAKRHWIYSMIALQIPKTASSSIAKCLSERNLLEKHKGLIHNRFSLDPLYRGVFDTRHLIPQHIYSIFGRQVFDFFSFAVIRNPVERLKSAFFFGKQNDLWKVYGLSPEITPDKFIAWLWESRKRQDILILLEQSTWTKSEIFRPTEIIKFENLNESWRLMIEKHNIEGISKILSHENKSDRPNEQVFSDVSLRIIEELYAKDFSNYYPNAKIFGGEEKINNP